MNLVFDMITLPYLRTLHLSYLACISNRFGSFMLRHSDTLEDLSMHVVCLRSQYCNACLEGLFNNCCSGLQTMKLTCLGVEGGVLRDELWEEDE